MILIMATYAELKEKLGTPPLESSPWFIHCALIALANGEDINEIHHSFQEAQEESIKKVNITFEWLKQELGF